VPRYVVKQGDRLWDIAQELLGDGRLWTQLLEDNPDIVTRAGDPTSLQIGAVIRYGTQDADGGGGGGDRRRREDDVQIEAGDIGADPVEVNGTTIPTGGRLVRVRNPKGADADVLFFYVVKWRGVDIAYEIGDRQRFRELFGSVEAFDTVESFGQAGFDNQEFVVGPSVDTILGSGESLESQFERDLRSLGLEDLPGWIRRSAEAKHLIARAAADGWSSGRLWRDLSKTTAFGERFGAVIDDYREGGVTIAEAVEGIVADEGALRDALRFLVPDERSLGSHFVQRLLAQGWTGTAAAQVLEQASILRSNPEMRRQANQVLEAAGLPRLNEVDFINAMRGHGPAEIVEALNTAAAGVALREAGLDDVDIDLLMDVVDTSDRLLTVDSFGQLAQQLAFNLIQNGAELTSGKLGLSRDDVVAAAFGEESPSGRSVGETLNLLARFERDRRAAGSGFEDATAFTDEKGRLRVQGLRGL